jgi:hypothetical protein
MSLVNLFGPFWEGGPLLEGAGFRGEPFLEWNRFFVDANAGW